MILYSELSLMQQINEDLDLLGQLSAIAKKVPKESWPPGHEPRSKKDIDTLFGDLEADLLAKLDAVACRAVMKLAAQK